MKWTCNACGRYVDSSHTCYVPRAQPQTEVEQLTSLNDSYRRDLDAERSRVRELEAKLKRIQTAVFNMSKNAEDAGEDCYGIDGYVLRALEKIALEDKP